MSEKNHRLEVTLASGNYGGWKQKMFSLLVLRELQDVLEWEQPENAPVAEEALTEYNEWMKKSGKVRALIELNIDDSNSQRVRGITSGKIAWDTLKVYHQRNNVGNLQRLQEKISSLKKTESISMEQHLNYLFDLVARYKEAGAEYNDDQFVNRILNSIRGTYKHLCDSISVQAEYKKDPWGLRLWLIDYADLDEEAEKVSPAAALKVKSIVKPEVQDVSSSEEEAQTTGKKVRSEVHKVSHQQRKVIRLPVNPHANYICNVCKQMGHIKAECTADKLSIAELEQLLKRKKMNKAKAANVGQDYTNCVTASNVLYACGDWIIDSGATSHMTPHKNLFTDIDNSHRSLVRVADGKKIPATGIGKVKLELITSKGTKVLLLENVLHVPNLNSSLFSIREFTASGKSVMFDSSKVYLMEKDEKLLIGQMKSDHYKLYGTAEAMLASELPCVHELHKRFAHRNLQDIRHMVKLGLQSRPCECNDFCEDCTKGKMARRPFKRSKGVQDVLDVVVSDVHGPMPVESLGRKRYFVTFIDAKSKYSEVHYMRQKNEVPDRTIEFIERLKTQFNKKPKVFRSDRGTEYLDQRLQNYLAREGIWYETTVGYAPQQNGIAERKNRTLGEGALTLLSDSKLPQNHWAEAVAFVNYCNNRIIAKNQELSPLQMFCGEKPDWSEMKEFGCDVFVLVPEQKRNKLQPKSKKMKFVGFDQHAKGYRVSDGNKIIISREVKFTDDQKKNKQPTKLTVSINDSEVPQSEKENQPTVSNVEPEVPPAQNERFFPVGFDITTDDETEPDEVHQENEDEWHDAIEQEAPNQQNQQPQEEPVVQEPVLRRSARTTAGRLPQRFDDYVLESCALIVSNDPKTDKEAMQNNEANLWKKAKQEELQTIKRNKTWEVVDLPKNRKAIGSKWVFKSKVSITGEKQYKARLVAQGFTQQSGIDYNDVFAPVANSTTMRILLTVSGMKSFHVRHYDIKSAFLNGDLQEEIYMRPPPGVNENGKVYRLKKSLYGLKQAANVWNLKLKEIFEKCGSIQSKDDECLFLYASGGEKMFLLVHVDDILAATSSLKILKEFMNRVGQQVEVKDLGEVQNYLGINMQRNEEGFFEISQTDYIQKMLEVTEMTDAKVSRIPMTAGYHKLEGIPLESNDSYRKLIGMLLYLSINSRPDIAAAVSILCQKVSAPTDVDLTEAKRILRYLKGTMDWKLTLGKKQAPDQLIAFTDSDWAEDRVDRKSNTGYLCCLSGALLAWKSKKQTIVATSSAEAEYIALSTAAKELLWIKRVAKSFGMNQQNPIKVFSDSTSAIAMVVNPKSSSKSKHIDTKFHHVKDLVAKKIISLEYVPTQQNVADILTKPLGKSKVKQFRASLGLRTLELEEECCDTIINGSYSN
jgi:transposase InsO family protein